MEDQKPQFIHDCKECVFLGRFNDSERVDYDLYFCAQSGNISTVVARYGDQGYEYSSGHGLRLLALQEAERRAILRGCNLKPSAHLSQPSPASSEQTS